MSGRFFISRDGFTTPIGSADIVWTTRIFHGVRRSLALWLSARSLHHRRAISGEMQIKRRIRLAGILVPLGNLYLRLQGAMSEILSTQQWVEWEITVADCYSNKRQVSVDRAGVILPVINGISLDEVVRADVPMKTRLQSIFLAARALKELHGWRLSACGVTDWPFSHGDATWRNVIVDHDANTATWIDFDLRHRIHLDGLFRRADDLRTFMSSCACGFEKHDYPNVIEAACNGYQEHEVIAEIQRLFRECLAPNLFQLAQAPLDVEEYLHLRELVGRIEIAPECTEPQTKTYGMTKPAQG